MELSQSAMRLTGQPMFRLLDAIKKREAAGQHFIHFEIGDPDFDSPQEVKIRASQAIRNNKSHYTSSQGLLDLRQEIATTLTTMYNLDMPIKASQVVIAPGCNPLIYCLLKILCNEGDYIRIPNPGFPTYQAAANVLNLNVTTEPEKPKLCIINSPCNPTGKVHSENVLQAFHTMRDLYGKFIISDEIYQFMNYREFMTPSICKYDPMFENTAVISGFSKTFAMTGWRIGFMISNEEICEKVSLLLQTLISCTNTFTQFASLGLMRKFPSEYWDYMELLKARRDIIVKGLNSIPGIHCEEPEGAFYVWPNIAATGLDSYAFAHLMLENGVGLLPGPDFGSEGKGFVRLAFCVDTEQIVKGIDLIKTALKKRKK